MTRKKLLLFLAFAFTIAFHVSAQRAEETPDKAIKSIVGKWQLEKVYAGSREIAANPNSESRAWIEFNEDGTYTSQGESDDRGSYRLNENHSVLYLESEQKTESTAASAGDKLTEYSITIRDGMLTMLPKSENSGSTKYVYQRNGTVEGNR
ncbi:MAG TPA: DUF5004 domain-containing protein [Chryseolinea sp.]